jgi:pimeloyl-ACP methyl ester carboxylesterase
VWAIVQPQVAKFTRACSYDRAGAGFSDPGPLPRTSVRIADELHSALHHAGIQGPYILVGHAFGGDNVRTFAARYTAELAALVMVEADVGGPAEHKGDQGLIAGLRACREAIATRQTLPMLPERPGRLPRNCTQQFFRGLPEAMWSPELNAKLLELAHTKLAMYDSYASEMEQMPEDEVYLMQHEHSLGARPIRVLSTGNHGVHFLEPAPPQDPEHQKYEQEVARAQAKWLAMSSNAKQLFTEKSSEYIPFDEPSFVIEAIREVYSQSKPSGAATPPATTTAHAFGCRHSSRAIGCWASTTWAIDRGRGPLIGRVAKSSWMSPPMLPASCSASFCVAAAPSGRTDSG